MVEWSSEVNYMFKLSAFQQQLLDWVESTTPPGNGLRVVSVSVKVCA